MLNNRRWWAFLVVGLLAVLQGCSGRSSSSNGGASCNAGDEHCDCLAGNACSGSLTCQSGKCEQPPACTTGNLGCPCTAAHTCNDASATCNPTTNQCETCPRGGLGCACQANNRCGISPTGAPLSCTNNTCQVASCPAGQQGCACKADNSCDASTDVCRDAMCRPAECSPGELNCECAGGSCAGSNLICMSNTCVDNTGNTGGPCRADGTCLGANRCDLDVCTACAPGSLGCSCTSSMTCGGGLTCASNGTCAVPGVGAPPANPLCYTPCERGMDSDAGYRNCSAEGLMDGCTGGRTCVSGSCLAANEPVPTCTSDAQCPDFQACLDGHCYSNCQLNSECSTTQTCYRHVCREVCSSSQSQGCGPNLHCALLDGTNGVCTTATPPTGTPQTEVDGAFTVDQLSLEFSNIRTTATIKITNLSPAYKRFKVHKRGHIVTQADGTVETLDDPDDATACDAATNCPLFWLKIGAAGAAGPVQDYVVGVEGNGGSTVVEISNAGGTSGVRFTGSVEVSGEKLDRKAVNLNFAERPEGQWHGSLYYFSTFGDRDLTPWRASQATRDDETLQRAVGNALVQRWGAFRRGRISFDEFQAVLTATRTESWRFPAVSAVCDAARLADGACYLYDRAGAAGVAPYTSSNDSFPIPTGVTELPLVMNLRQPTPDTNPATMSGRIDSAQSLQYAGNPAVNLQFSADPSTCMRNVFGSCVTFLDNLDADVLLGGRYLSDPTDMGCARHRPDATYELWKTPWLVPGFERATVMDTQANRRYRYECRDTGLPFVGATQAEKDAFKPLNLSQAAANPVPDGRARKRTIRLIDGAIVNGTQIFALFEESFDSFLDPNDQGTAGSGAFKAYGYLMITRARTDVDTKDANNNQVPDAFEGSVQADMRPQPTDVLDVSCNPDLIDKIIRGQTTVTETNAATVVSALLTGTIGGGSAPTPLSANESVHYLCVDTGLFDGGRGNRTAPGTPLTVTACAGHVGNNLCEDNGPGSIPNGVCALGSDPDCPPRTSADQDTRVPCPAGSEVIYFTVNNAGMTQDAIANLPCQADRTCAAQLNDWRTSRNVVVQYKPLWRCAPDNLGHAVNYCNDNRLDLRAAKTFFAASSVVSKFQPIHTEIDNAFRYKTRFVSRGGSTVGFAPEICLDGGADLIPYCYDPKAIEAIRERVDCLLSIWKAQYVGASSWEGASTGITDATLKNDLVNYLTLNFADDSESHPAVVHDGYERLQAELLIMLGDEAYTAAFASRFDLANTRTVGFEGSKFETDGIDLSGVAGYEMFSLYQAAQYYQEVLDRFYALSPLVWQALKFDVAGKNFITYTTVVRYFDRLIRASTQKTRALSEIARRYQSFNRPDLARRVVERAYTGAYLESIVMSRMTLRAKEVSLPQQRTQLRKALEDGQRRYRVAMLEMRNVYSSITDGTSFYGLAPDYVPLPALDGNTLSSFELVMSRANEKTRVAREREDLALATGRSFDTDAAQFQSELTRIRNTYENQLGDVCGNFEAADHRVYPAISKYAALDTRASLLGNPCGLMGNGQIAQAMAELGQMGLDLQKVVTEQNNVLAEVAIEQNRVALQCNLIATQADYVYTANSQVQSLRQDIAWTRFAIATADRALHAASTVATLSKCSLIVGTAAGGDCPMAGVAAAVFAGVTAGVNIDIAILEGTITAREQDIASMELDTARWQTLSQCDAAVIESNATTARMLLRLKELDLDLLKAQRRIDQAMSDLKKQYNDATRLQLEQADTEQLSINVEAARNDPNVRIYKNDAIINADFSFFDAMREAYRATKVFEYYTSQSYPDTEKLYLIRMVARGDFNLENYLVDMTNAYNQFEESFGNPDQRVQIISLRDDILRIPRVDEAGAAVNQDARIRALRDRLKDTAYLDENGYLTYSFSTGYDALSPLTRNHKVLAVESEIIGSDVGDTVGRVYVRQVGTGSIKGLDDQRNFFRLPQRTAVLNPFFNGQRIFLPDVYRNARLRDRPLVNTAWELVINQRDENANKDINLQSITDVRLYVYYTDFTQF